MTISMRAAVVAVGGLSVIMPSVLGADLGTVCEGGFTVRFDACVKCPYRMRLKDDASGATVNVSRLSDDRPSPSELEARKLKMAERAFAILKVAADAPESSKGVTNLYLLAMGRNDLAAPSYVAWRDKDDAAQAIVKDAVTRFGTTRYLELSNATDKDCVFEVSFAALELGGKVAVVDLVEAADIGEFSGVFKMSVPPRGVRFYRLDAERRLEKTKVR